MLITKLGHYQAILGKSWMNVHGVALDMMYDHLIFLPGRCCHAGAPTELAPHPQPLPDLRITPCMPYTPQQAYEILNSKPKPLPMPPPTPPTSPISILKRSASSPVPEPNLATVGANKMRLPPARLLPDQASVLTVSCILDLLHYRL